MKTTEQEFNRLKNCLTKFRCTENTASYILNKYFLF